MAVKLRGITLVAAVGAILGGTWVGVHVISSTPHAKTAGVNTTERPTHPNSTIMTAPPAENRSSEVLLAVTMTTETQPSPLNEEPTVSATDENIKSLIETTKKPLDNEKKFEVRYEMTKAILAAPEGQERDALKKTLDAINSELFFSRTPTADSRVYKIEAGDTLSGISAKLHKGPYFHHLIMLVNGIRYEDKISIGKTLKIPDGRFSARVQKGAHRLIILFNGHYIREYPVAIGGATSPTPEGIFVIEKKILNPDWYGPDGMHKYGDPKNILGTRWLGFAETKDYQGYGIHGTTQPETIGKDVSNGCVRMLNNDVEEIFGMLMPGDPAEIVK